MPSLTSEHGTRDPHLEHSSPGYQTPGLRTVISRKSPLTLTLSAGVLVHFHHLCLRVWHKLCKGWNQAYFVHCGIAHLAQWLEQSWYSIFVEWMNEWILLSFLSVWHSPGNFKKLGSVSVSFTRITSLNHHDDIMKWRLFSAQFHRRRNGSTELKQSGAKNCPLTHSTLLPQS